MRSLVLGFWFWQEIFFGGQWLVVSSQKKTEHRPLFHLPKIKDLKPKAQDQISHKLLLFY